MRMNTYRVGQKMRFPSQVRPYLRHKVKMLERNGSGLGGLFLEIHRKR